MRKIKFFLIMILVGFANIGCMDRAEQIARIQEINNQPVAAHHIVDVNAPAANVDDQVSCCSEDASWQKPASRICMVAGPCLLILALVNSLECFVGCN